MISPTYTDETVETDKFTLAFDALVREAEKAIALFREYRGHHAAKEPPDIGKAIRNNDAADDLEVALKAALSAVPRPSTGSDAGDLVKRLENAAAYIRGEPCVGATAYPLTVPGRAMADLYSESAASIAALSEELAETRCENAALHGLCDHRFEEIAALSEENERLKAALGEVVNPDITKAGK